MKKIKFTDNQKSLLSDFKEKEGISFEECEKIYHNATLKQCFHKGFLMNRLILGKSSVILTGKGLEVLEGQ